MKFADDTAVVWSSPQVSQIHKQLLPLVHSDVSNTTPLPTHLTNLSHGLSSPHHSGQSHTGHSIQSSLCTTSKHFASCFVMFSCFVYFISHLIVFISPVLYFFLLSTVSILFQHSWCGHPEFRCTCTCTIKGYSFLLFLVFFGFTGVHLTLHLPCDVQECCFYLDISTHHFEFFLF